MKCRTTTAREQPPPAARSDSATGRSFCGRESETTVWLLSFEGKWILPVACCRRRGWLPRLLPFRLRRTVFLIFLCRRHHLFHPFFDLVDLGVHFFDEVMFDLGQLLNSFALLPQLFQNIKISFCFAEIRNIHQKQIPQQTVPTKVIQNAMRFLSITNHLTPESMPKQTAQLQVITLWAAPSPQCLNRGRQLPYASFTTASCQKSNIHRFAFARPCSEPPTQFGIAI